jgi:hypothetical protein
MTCVSFLRFPADRTSNRTRPVYRVEEQLTRKHVVLTTF